MKSRRKQPENTRDLLDRAKINDVFSDGKLIEQAVRLHKVCSTCHGGGGGFHPEQPCPECGLNCFDSLGLENVKI